MKIITKYILLIFVVLLTTSCEEFLREEPTSFINPATFFKTKEDADASVVAGYSKQIGGSFYGAWRDFCWEEATDDFYKRPLFGTAQVLYDYEAFGPDHGVTDQVYNTFINGINTCCVAVDGIEGMEDFTNKETLIAEAKFLRAFSYFNLVRVYGRVPLLTEGLGDDEVREIPRSNSVDEIYDLIVSDLEAGASDLWETAPAPGRATKWTAMSLLAKVHLTLQNWSEAAQLAQQVVDESPHILLPVYEDIFAEDNENNDESIFEIQYVVTSQKSNQVGNWPRGIGPVGGKDYFLGPAWGGGYICSEDFLNSFEPGDVRREQIDTMVVKDDGTEVVFNADGEPPYYPIKRVPRSYINYLESNNNTGLNFICLRLGEVYLIAAEAENEANGPDNAYQYINPVRQRAGLDDLSGLSKEQFREAVRNERRHELFDERIRYFDLLRWGNLVERIRAVKPDSEIQDFHVLWPIPTSAIDRNPALEGDQNPGY